MRHRVAHRKLGRVSEHRIALLRNQAQALLRHERISTTVAKAKELRPFVERIITVAKRGIVDGSDGVRVLNARRIVARDLGDRQIVQKLFDTIAPRFVDRPGGYTRILKAGRRQGDQVEIAYVELIGSEYSSDLKTDVTAEDEQESRKESVGGRIRKAAQRIRGSSDNDSKKEKNSDS